MDSRRTIVAMGPALVALVVALLAPALIERLPAHAQSGDPPTCSTGTAVPDPANNPGLVSDCEALLDLYYT